MPGQLILCGTPIGNLGDITLRALETLKKADFIAAEDTRHTLKLLNAYDIHTPLISYHAHSSAKKADQLIDLLLSGKQIALVTDAGMPGISDPGGDLVALCHENGISVTAAPGPSAGITALAMSGLSCDRFVFEGFLPNAAHAKKERRKRLLDIASESRTVILYEAPHHLLDTLKALAEYIPNRKLAVLRELTKIHESKIWGDAETLYAHFEANPPRGEFVIVIDAKPVSPDETAPLEPEQMLEKITAYLSQGVAEMQAVKNTAQEAGVKKSVVYKIWTDAKQKG